MATLNRILLVLHFLGLAMGLGTSFANMVMGALIARADPAHRPILWRFIPMMAKVGRHGLELLWLTGVAMVFTKYQGFSGLPWQFHVKLTAVVLLTVGVIYILRLERQATNGDAAAAARMPLVGKFTFLMAVTAIVFAVWTFE